MDDLIKKLINLIKTISTMEFCTGVTLTNEITNVEGASYIFKDNFFVTVQSYITKNELDTAWSSAIKRAFDLSIDSAGKLYEYWHQQSNPAKSIGNKNKKLIS